ncbi:DNA cytosine methyltransferase [Antarcticirhabdus aurantiaca]|uniref:DNA cytosine methyltransferase n=1 Tax=Antarcticirhabdus aurantiaca TaxID=2606717 RepID=UPI001FEDEFDF|nr:DNA cytosine methyltransferase [Antarcticirhabdus aurantiaca]
MTTSPDEGVRRAAQLRRVRCDMSAARAYYNEIDPDAAAVLRELITDDVIAPGDVDTRSIQDVRADDLRPYTQCHFFAGGGLWSVAARLAGWPDNRPLWTGSCPCQPLSPAGRKRGADDPRHLWPDLFRLIRSRRPPAFVGEQVAGPLGDVWFDGVHADLASAGYASRAVDIPACALNAPQERERRWIAACPDSVGRRARVVEGEVPRHNGAQARDRSRWPSPSSVPRLDDGVPGSVALRRIAGNAIYVPLAAEVIAALMDALPEVPYALEAA